MAEFKLTEEQSTIINPTEFTSAMIIAKAGSGKTNTLVRRAINQAKDTKPWKDIAIISFTNKSCEDIRLKIKELGGKQIITATFHSFLISHVLSFANIFRNKRILFDYGTRTNNLSEWINTVKETSTITSSRNTKDDYIFQHALRCLNTNPYIRKYLRNRFEAIYIDEAQDNNELQYDIVEYFLGIGIQIVLVGDPNQTIYGFRGADAYKFESMKLNENFKNNIYELTRNFRCHEFISNCAENYEIPNQSNTSKEDGTTYGVWVDYESRLSKIVNLFNKPKFENEGLAFLFRSVYKSEFSKQVIKDYNLIVVDLPQFIRSRSNEPEYEKNLDLLFNLYFGNSQFEHFFIQTFLSHIKYKDAKKLIKEFKNNLGIESLNNLNDFLEYIKAEDYKAIINSMNLPETRQFYELDKTKNIAMTIHSAKGLEFKNVILIAKDFNDIEEESTQNLFYVACTRAEKRLLFIK